MEVDDFLQRLQVRSQCNEFS